MLKKENFKLQKKETDKGHEDYWVRRFDDLGRIVIPKEMRKQLFGTPEKSEGMPMEIFMNKDDIVLRKYIEHISDDVCEWKRRTDDNFLHTSCNNRAGAYSDEFKYCPYCGKKIKVVE